MPCRLQANIWMLEEERGFCGWGSRLLLLPRPSRGVVGKRGREWKGGASAGNYQYPESPSPTLEGSDLSRSPPYIQSAKPVIMETLLGFEALGMHASELHHSTIFEEFREGRPEFPSPETLFLNSGNAEVGLWLLFRNARHFSENKPDATLFLETNRSELAGDDIMMMFLEERQLRGDFISRASDMIWRRDVLNSGYVKPAVMEEHIQPFEESKDEDLGGFLKLTKTQEWVSGNDIAPFNKKMDSKLKRELLLLTMGIGTACTGYCFFTFSVEAAVSYAAGVLFRVLKQIQFLGFTKHSSGWAQEVNVQCLINVWSMHKKTHLQPRIYVFLQSICIDMVLLQTRIGIRSDDLKNAFDRTVNGSIMALSSPRLVIPAAIYGFWLLFHHFPNINFDFQLVPAMFGMFAYKAACLVQVYRDNEDLLFEFPQNDDGIDN
ncbi:hypothetical protein ACLOJK_025022 [Asimina triloba]